MSTKDNILFTALELFNTKGYGNVGVREIARELKISPGNLSYHFSKKEDILFNLLNEFNTSNNSFYEEHQTSEPSIERFLILMKNIFYSQYKFRGVYIGNQFVQHELQSLDRFNYSKIADQRKENFKKIFTDLVHFKEIMASGTEVDFLVSFISLFGRFWIQEAFLLQKVRDKHEVITHYLKILMQQLSLFATKKGQKSIELFRVNHLPK
jgi:AcrR family transcriptional regulator